MQTVTPDKFKPATHAGNKERVVRKSLSYWADAWRRLKKNKLATFGLIVLSLLAIFAIIGPFIQPYDYQSQDYAARNIAPGTAHWFGTDDLGRDQWVRVWWGVRISLFIGIISAALDFTIGVLYGGISAYFGGRVDDIMQRIIEILMGLPYMIIVILLMMVMGPGIFTIIVALAAVGWVGMARLVRGQMLSLKEQEYVLAARTLGASSWRIILRHLIPNALGIIIINVTFTVPGAIFAEAFLSFIGLGIKPPMASLGSLVNDGMQVMRNYPYRLLCPSIVFSLIMLSFNLLGDGLRDALDPRLRK
ncbi:ABC transporter permease [Tumebacillus permanentifrigoris]|uniref:Oligopeptide transport system permease protein n=1 Tax=Tumebacillus permanentifrigoris TaxID=378543 RepID=A0A316DAM6_9BACL|nr:ABC transporter permease [Tumebacillus permanentifrigoris]PWK13882.1 oligopeptide transport system permease protein [Tumebacillus permanentifrigoris]